MAQRILMLMAGLCLGIMACSSEPAGSVASNTAGQPTLGASGGSAGSGAGSAPTPAMESGGSAGASTSAGGTGGTGGGGPASGEGGDGGAPASEEPTTPPPPDLVKCVDAKPYVEGNCSPTTVSGWPHPAQACTYDSPLGELAVTVANPSAEQVAIWIVDAGDSVPAIAHLKGSDPPSYLRALQSVAAALMIQSSRIFPIAGDIGEDMGGGYVAYPFTKGVTKPCPSGEPHCYCRINSLSRSDYCAYQAFLEKESVADCRSRVGYGQGATDAWLDECIGNHAAAWDTPSNAHIRAQVWSRINASGLTETASGPSVVKALDGSYGIGNSTVAAFCK